MIGNDIIDLAAVRERSPRHWECYRAKVMTISEQKTLACRRLHLRQTGRSKSSELLTQHPENNLDIWFAWAVKESVYKLEFQMDQERYFAPKQIQILEFDPINQQGRAQGKLATYPFEIHFIEGFIHALVWSPERSKPSYQHLHLDALPLDQHLEEILKKQFPNQQLHYKRWPFPQFIIDHETTIPVSMSHHGRWGAFAF
ncbi:MAG: hypothetical protein Sapg2KO_22460 [Saprospiraceae bacterium]